LRVAEVPIDKLCPSPFNIRRSVSESDFEEIYRSVVARRRVEQPIIVRPVGDRFEIVAGYLRYLAARKAGLKAIPAIVREMDDREALKTSLVENVFRREVDVVDKAIALRRLYEMDRSTRPEAAQSITYWAKRVEGEIGLDWRQILRYLSLAEADEEIQRLVSMGLLDMHSASTISRAPPERQREFARELRARISIGRRYRQRELYAAAREAVSNPQRDIKEVFDDADAMLLRDKLGLDERVARFAVSERLSEEEVSRLASVLEALKELSSELYEEVVGGRETLRRALRLSPEHVKEFARAVRGGVVERVLGGLGVDVEREVKRLFFAVLLSGSPPPPSGVFKAVEEEVARRRGELLSEIVGAERAIRDARDLLGQVEDLLSRLKAFARLGSDVGEWLRTLDDAGKGGAEVVDRVAAEVEEAVRFIPQLYDALKRELVLRVYGARAEAEPQKRAENVASFLRNLAAMLDDDFLSRIGEAAEALEREMLAQREDLKRAEDAVKGGDAAAAREAAERVQEGLRAIRDVLRASGDVIRMYLDMARYVSLLRKDEYANAERIERVRWLYIGLADELLAAARDLDAATVRESVRAHAEDDEVDRYMYIRRFLEVLDEVEPEVLSGSAPPEIAEAFEEAVRSCDLALLEDVRARLVSEVDEGPEADMILREVVLRLEEPIRVKLVREGGSHALAGEISVDAPAEVTLVGVSGGDERRVVLPCLHVRLSIGAHWRAATARQGLERSREEEEVLRAIKLREAEARRRSARRLLS